MEGGGERADRKGDVRIDGGGEAGEKERREGQRMEKGVEAAMQRRTPLLSKPHQG